MLPYALAIVVGLSSSVLFVTAFFLPDLHRQDDFLWSGVGLFYALVLWFCATSIGGAVLLGQLAVVALLTAYFWQMLKLRQAVANPEKAAGLDSFSVVDFVKNRFQKSPKVVNSTKEAVIESKKEKEAVSATPETVSDKVNDGVIETKNEIPPPVAKIVEDSSQESKDDAEAVADSTPTLTNTNLNEILDESEAEKTEVAEKETTPPPQEATVAEKTPPEKTQETEVTEIAVEKVTVVEEETNWDDEVEDIPASAVTVIQESTTEPTENAESSKESGEEKKNDGDKSD